DRALDHLFSSASFLVAPRAGHTMAALDELFARPENRRYRSHVRPLPLPPTYAEASSTEVRVRAAAGLTSPAAVPPESTTFMAETEPYSPPRQRSDGTMVDHYGTRLALVERLLSQGARLAPGEVRRLYHAELAR